MGSFNSGKTHWANKISDLNLPKGDDTETYPISIKLPDDPEKSNLNVIDSGGKGRAIRLYKEYKQMIKDQ